MELGAVFSVELVEVCIQTMASRRRVLRGGNGAAKTTAVYMAKTTITRPAMLATMTAETEETDVEAAPVMFEPD